MKPVLCEKGHVTVVSVVFPPASGGSSVIMANVLNYFDPSSVSVLGAQWPNEKINLADLEIKRTIVYTRQPHSWKLNKIKEGLERKSVVKRIKAEVVSKKSVAIMAVYPDLFLFECALAAAEQLDLPFIPYLHDTVVETQESESARKRAEEVQRRYFERSKNIFVMSDGMKNLFERKHSKECLSLIHTYPEEIQKQSAGETKSGIMFTGDVYKINTESIKRIANGCKSVGERLKIATNKDLNYHTNLGLDPDSIELVFYPNRPKYLEALRKTKVLVLGLSWPDETTIHFDEMSTIFPTKTCEFLASGSQILVHCPKEYFLAEFMTENECCRYVGDRNEQVLASTIKEMVDLEGQIDIVDNALETVKRFSVNEVAPFLKRVVDQQLA